MPGTMPGMASTTLQGWVAGSTVTAHRYAEPGAPLGTAITSGVADSEGRATLDDAGLLEGVQYLAVSGSRRSNFSIAPAPPSLESLAARISALEAVPAAGPVFVDLEAAGFYTFSGEADSSDLVIYFAGASDATVEIPADSAVDMPVGTRVFITNAGFGGNINFSAMAPANVNYAPWDWNESLTGQQLVGTRPGLAVAVKVAANQWFVQGVNV